MVVERSATSEESEKILRELEAASSEANSQIQKREQELQDYDFFN